MLWAHHPCSQELKAEIAKITGAVTPTPAKASFPTSGMCPINILSTKLYKILISCAATAGSASFINAFGTGMAANNSLSFSIFHVPPTIAYAVCKIIFKLLVLLYYSLKMIIFKHTMKFISVSGIYKKSFLQIVAYRFLKYFFKHTMAKVSSILLLEHFSNTL